MFPLFLLPIVHLAAAAADGIDESFGDNGVVLTNIAFPGVVYEVANGAAVQSDGKIVVVGTTHNSLKRNFAVARYNTDGSPDDSFSDDGHLSTSIGCGDDEAYDVAIQPDGKILVAGRSRSASPTSFALVRYHADGSLDTTFSGDGIATTRFGDVRDTAEAIALQGDGKIVVAGHAVIEGRFDFAVARYNTDGSLDTSFSGDGRITTDFGGGHDLAYDLAIQSDGKIIVIGNVDNHGGWLRYNSDGSLDTTLSETGLVFDCLSGCDGLQAVALQDDGKIVITGTSEGALAVLRYLPDGRLDSGFATGGQARVDSVGFNAGRSVAVQPDGKIVVAAAGDSVYPKFAVCRFSADGILDPGFSSDGLHTTRVGIETIDEEEDDAPVDLASTVILQDDGRIIVAGKAYRGEHGEHLAIVRYLTDGSLDPAFSEDGKVIDAIAASGDTSKAVAVHPDGKVLVMGQTNQTGGRDVVLTRHLPDGSLDLSFSADGRVLLPIANYAAAAEAMVVQPNGQILITGAIQDLAAGSDEDFFLARLNVDGTFDASFGVGGWISAELGGRDTGNAIALQGDGKILIAGESVADGVRSIAVSRHFSNGSLDQSFSDNGFLVLEGDGAANDIAARSDGKIVVAGQLGRVPNQIFALLQLDAFGAPDQSFGDDGFVTPAFPDPSDSKANTVTVQPDGKIVVAGQARLDSDQSVVGFAVARYLPDGNLDSEFSENGWLTTRFIDYAVCTSLVLMADGRIVAGGYSARSRRTIALARYLPDGSLDLSLSGDGRINADVGLIPWSPIAIAVQDDEKIVVAGKGGGDSSSDFLLARFLGTSEDGGTDQERWRNFHFETPNSMGDAADDQDPDQDGLVNFVEWAVDQDPTIGGPSPIEVTIANNWIEVIYSQRFGAVDAGVQYAVEWSRSLGPSALWSREGVTELQISSKGTTRRKEARISLPSEGRLFVRLKISEPQQ